jgi:beta-carotene ketolase (CrtW type)
MAKTLIRKNNTKAHTGILIGLLIIGLWFALLNFNLSFYQVDYTSPWTYLLILLQGHLYTGLFITAHDAMHGTVAPHNQKLNHFIGRLCTLLFMFNSYKTLFPKHHEHHAHAGTHEDPDFHKGNPNFWVWFFNFAKEYVTIWQILAAAVTFNLLKLVLPTENLILFWIVPSFLAMLQLFFFGTYLPHRGEHEADNPHHARSQKRNHAVAFLSCYFFGYHYEHHDSPGTPWWRLWEKKG